MGGLILVGAFFLLQSGNIILRPLHRHLFVTLWHLNTVKINWLLSHIHHSVRLVLTVGIFVYSKLSASGADTAG